MNLEQMRASLDEKLTRLREIRASDNVTDELRQEATTLLAESQELRTKIEAAQEEESRFSDLENFNNKAVEGRSLNNQRVGGGVHQSAGQTAQQGSSQRSRTTDEVQRTWENDLSRRGFTDPQIQRAMSEDYRSDFDRFIRAGNDGMSVMRALNESLISDGGALIPLEMQREIIQRLAAPKRLYGAVKKLRGSSDSTTIPKFLGGSSTQQSGLAVQWLGESGSAAEDTSLENWGNVKIEAHRGSTIVVASRSWLEDAAFEMEAWISEMIADMYTAAIEYIILNGSGVGRPFGILTRKGTGAEDIEGVNIGNPIGAAELINLLGEIDEQYADNASFVMRRSTFFTQIADLKDSVGGFHFGTNNTTDGGTQRRIENILLGYPNLLSDHMPAGAGAASVLLYGDLRMAYALLERVAMSIEPYIDPAIQKKDQVGWYVRFRLGGDVWQPQAAKIGVQS